MAQSSTAKSSTDVEEEVKDKKDEKDVAEARFDEDGEAAVAARRVKLDRRYDEGIFLGSHQNTNEHFIPRTE